MSWTPTGTSSASRSCSTPSSEPQPLTRLKLRLLPIELPQEIHQIVMPPRWWPWFSFLVRRSSPSCLSVFGRFFAPQGGEGVAPCRKRRHGVAFRPLAATRIQHLRGFASVGVAFCGGLRQAQNRGGRLGSEPKRSTAQPDPSRVRPGTEPAPKRVTTLAQRRGMLVFVHSTTTIEARRSAPEMRPFSGQPSCAPFVPNPGLRGSVHPWLNESGGGSTRRTQWRMAQLRW